MSIYIYIYIYSDQNIPDCNRNRRKKILVSEASAGKDFILCFVLSEKVV